MQRHANAQVVKPRARQVPIPAGAWIGMQWEVYDETGAAFADTLDEAYRLWVELYINFALYPGDKK